MHKNKEAARREYMKNYMRARRANPPARIAEEKEEPWCNFCGCTATERILVKAPDDAPYPAHICASCVENAAAAVTERQGPWWR